jgi:hypothetical protein
MPASGASPDFTDDAALPDQARSKPIGIWLQDEARGRREGMLIGESDDAGLE